MEGALLDITLHRAAEREPGFYGEPLSQDMYGSKTSTGKVRPL